MSFTVTIQSDTDKFVEGLTDQLEMLTLKPSLKTIPKSIRHVRSIAIDTLSEGTIISLKAIKEYTHYRVRKIMIYSEGKYYHSNPFMEEILNPLKTDLFQLRLDAFEKLVIKLIGK